MADQLLRAHEVMEYVYNIADVAYPVSIRDQMNRGYWIVQKAYDLGFFGANRESKYRRLLVCGAGAAGVTAALHAVNLGVETHLIEKSAAPFLRQRLCRSRWLDPTQYDWSAPSWALGSFPYPSTPLMPLPWNEDRSNRLALTWQPILNSARSNPLLTYRRDHVVGVPTSAIVSGNIAGVTVNFNSGAVDDYGMMLWCIGFGDERRTAPPTYKGFAFWETDPYERPKWGISAAPMDPCAIVSGGGDGALQDVIRLTTRKKSAKEVYSALLGAGWAMPSDVQHALAAAEDQAQRALLWCTPGSPDEHRALQSLHDAYVNAVQYLVRFHPSKAVLVHEVNRLLACAPYPVELFHSCTHFARTYSLNHFLVLLLAEVGGKLMIRPQTGVDTVTGVPPGHVCGNPRGCHGVQHDVTLMHRPSCHAAAGGPAGKRTACVVVIRHGIRPNAAFAGTTLDFARQVMPYHIP